MKKSGPKMEVVKGGRYNQRNEGPKRKGFSLLEYLRLLFKANELEEQGKNPHLLKKRAERMLNNRQ